jgi:hypothetical protein
MRITNKQTKRTDLKGFTSEERCNWVEKGGPARLCKTGGSIRLPSVPIVLPRRGGVKVFMAASATFFARAEKDRGGSARTGRRVLTQRGA